MNQKKLTTRIIDQGKTEYYLTAGIMSDEEFTLSRKQTFGGSDSAVLINTNKWKTLEELRVEKSNKFLTDEEKEISTKPAVRKGRDLEPLILNKCSKELKKKIYKPIDTFKFRDCPELTVNFDGITIDKKRLISIEAKYVTTYGTRNYSTDITLERMKKISYEKTEETIEEHIQLMSAKLGIPEYYYSQVQLQIDALDNDYGYLYAWFESTWEGKLYYIKRDQYVIDQIRKEARVNKDVL